MNFDYSEASLAWQKRIQTFMEEHLYPHEEKMHQFHQDPQIVHYPDVRQRQKILPGMTFTVEPMINVGSHKCIVWPDDWTAVTVDGLRSAQFEHTILVTESGFELLTGGQGDPWFKRQLARGW